MLLGFGSDSFIANHSQSRCEGCGSFNRTRAYPNVAELEWDQEVAKCYCGATFIEHMPELDASLESVVRFRTIPDAELVLVAVQDLPCFVAVKCCWSGIGTPFRTSCKSCSEAEDFLVFGNRRICEIWTDSAENCGKSDGAPHSG